MTAVESIIRDLPACKIFINGRWEDGYCRRSIDVHNPATGQLLTTVPDGSAEDIGRAVDAARLCFEKKTWRGLPPSKREKILWDISEIISSHQEELSVLISMENGKTVREAAAADVAPAVDAFRYYAGWVRKLHGETIPVDGAFLNYTQREPLGVVGAIVPWNYPLQIAVWKVAPALACGCSVVLKPSEMTPLSALKLAECCTKAGLPDGALNVVTGYGETAGETLALHMDVDKLSFTGSAETARRLLEASAESNLKRVSLELGGKSPHIVFPDADLEAAEKAAFWGIFANKGEICTAGSRLLLHASIYDRFVERLVERARNMRVGDPLDPETQMGSQISGKQMDRVLGYVRSGIDEGARLCCGGERDTEGSKRNGFFIKPAIFSDVTPRMKIAQEEIFGPVLAAMRFEDAEEAVKIANSTVYGLAAAIWTRDLKLAHRMASELRAGTVWINGYNQFDSASPFGGCKQSGYGRDLGAHALEQYTHIKSVWIAL